jgi:hypothetical protein
MNMMFCLVLIQRDPEQRDAFVSRRVTMVDPAQYAIIRPFAGTEMQPRI